MQLDFAQGALLLLFTAALVAMLTRRLRVPYSVGLVAAGMALAALRVSLRITLTRDLIYDTLLPPLLFEAAFYLRWKELRRELPVILTLATVGVIVSGAIVTLAMVYLANWPLPAALVFGALIAATDPVAVIATFRDAKAHGRLPMLIEAESLFNDGTAAVAFGLAVAFAGGHETTAWAVAANLAVTIGGAILCGGGVAALALFLTGRTQDHLVEITFTTVAAYGSFLLAEELHCSGVFAVITAGLIIGNRGPLCELSDRGREAVDAFWEYAAFVANSLVFLLIGMQEARQNFDGMWISAAIAIAAVTLSRAAAVYPLCAIFTRSSLRITLRHQHVLFWGGLRGALALALALGLPNDLPGRAQIIGVSFSVVAFSVFVQGLTMPPMLRRMGEIPRNDSAASG